MPICSNPKTRRIKVPVGQGAVILVLREYSAVEYTRFMSGRYEFKRQGQIEDRSMQSRLRFVDSLLEGLEAQDAQGKPDTVTYVDPESGKEAPLTPQVEDWTNYVNPSWKIAAAIELEGESVEIENVALKN
ncbi:MAG: hypothetical protein NPINA01_17990 [Nitrospinaceae bacterium]|nr:MAG: hypothetical protein NPINA01_17990 [Nitrospinaceae bacterium]